MWGWLRSDYSGGKKKRKKRNTSLIDCVGHSCVFRAAEAFAAVGCGALVVFSRVEEKPLTLCMLRKAFSSSRVCHTHGLILVLVVKVTELKSLANHVVVGSVSCEMLDLFCPLPQTLAVDINDLGTVKLNLEVTWRYQLARDGRFQRSCCCLDHSSHVFSCFVFFLFPVRLIRTTRRRPPARFPNGCFPTRALQTRRRCGSRCFM